MEEPTSLLFGLTEFEVVHVDRLGPEVLVIIEVIAVEGGCPGCGVLSARVKDRPLLRVKDLPACGQRTQVWWRKRRLACTERGCPVGSFTQTSALRRSRWATHHSQSLGAESHRRLNLAQVRGGHRVQERATSQG